MEVDFWHQRWQKNEIAFHMKHANPMLIKYFSRLALVPASRVFVPLCGKTLDIGWLLSQGHRVVAAELNEDAVQQLFKELEVEPQVTVVAGFKCYSTEGLDVFVGNIFELTADLLGTIDAVYDRAALVALPEVMRFEYSANLRQITQTVPQLLLTFEYDQSLLSGPPFSLSKDEVTQHYQAHYELTELESFAMPGGGLKGKCPAHETVWLLHSL